MKRLSGARATAAGAAVAALLASSAAAAGEQAADANAVPTPALSGLIFDLRKMVEAQEALGWTIDRYELEDMMSPALMSVCSATPAARQAALDELDRRVEALGGPVEEAFRRSGGDLGAIRDVVSTARARALLAEAMRRAAAECPFWLQPSPAFRGRETDAYRTTLNLEGGGLGVLQTSAGRALLGAGGSARLLIGRGLNERWTFLAGGEFGGTAFFDERANETRFPIGFVVALPLVLRHQSLSWHYEGELASLAYFQREDLRPSPGLRAGGLVGVSGLRVRNIMPWAGVGAAFEYVFETSSRSAQWTLKAGARVGFDWDF